MNTNKLLSIATGALVLFLAVGAFVLSYDALRGLAADNGLNAGQSALFPLIVDGFIITAALSVVRNSLLSESVWYPWALVGTFTALSIFFNVSHSADKWLARGIAAVPPVALFLSFELLMGQVKSEVLRRTVTNSLDALSRQVTERQTELDKLVDSLDKLTVTRDELRTEVKELKQEKKSVSSAFVQGDLDALDKANDSRQAKIAERRETVEVLLAEGMSEADIADRLDVSTRTIRRDIKSLNGRVREAA